MNTLLLGSLAIAQLGFLLWLARGGAKVRSRKGATVIPGKGPMYVNTGEHKVWDRAYWDRIENTKKNYGG